MAHGELTLSLLGEQEISLGCSRQVRDTVSGIQQCRALVVRQLSVGLDCQGLVVAEMAAGAVVSLVACSRPKRALTCHRGT